MYRLSVTVGIFFVLAMPLFLIKSQLRQEMKEYYAKWGKHLKNAGKEKKLLGQSVILIFFKRLYSIFDQKIIN